MTADLENMCICGGHAYECALCHEKRCMECDYLSTTDNIKTAVRWCPDHREAGRLGKLEHRPGHCARCEAGLERVWDHEIDCYSHKRGERWLLCDEPWRCQPSPVRSEHVDQAG